MVAASIPIGVRMGRNFTTSTSRDCRRGSGWSSGPAFQVGASKLLFRVPVRGIGREFVPSHDGQKFLAIVPNSGTSQLLTLVQQLCRQSSKKK